MWNVLCVHTTTTTTTKWNYYLTIEYCPKNRNKHTHTLSHKYFVYIELELVNDNDKNDDDDDDDYGFVWPLCLVDYIVWRLWSTLLVNNRDTHTTMKLWFCYCRMLNIIYRIWSTEPKKSEQKIFILNSFIPISSRIYYSQAKNIQL